MSGSTVDSGVPNAQLPLLLTPGSDMALDSPGAGQQFNLVVPGSGALQQTQPVGAAGEVDPR